MKHSEKKMQKKQNMNRNEPGMVVTDFDGTLFSDEKKVNEKDLNTLVRLGEMGIKRVIATGRSIFSASKVIERDFPIDYLVFSSGAGIMKWKSGELIRHYSIKSESIRKIYSVLEKRGIDFMLHKEIPYNHYFYSVKQSDEKNSDFETRCTLYSDFILSGGRNEIFKLKNATQFLAIKSLEEFNDPDKIYHEIKESLPYMKVIRATSPIDGKSLWIEIFPVEVSKAKAADLICGIKRIDKSNVMVIGNDYNDADMLKWGGDNSFVVENAPDEFKKIFRNVSSNNSCGFSEAVEEWLSMQ